MKNAIASRISLACAAIILLQLALALLGPSTVCAQPEPGISDFLESSQKNLFIFTTVEDFEKGETDGTEITLSGHGAVILCEGLQSGTYTSPTVETEPFEYMVLSWNADTPGSTYVEIQGRVHVLGRWSKWLSWGKWSSAAFNEKGRINLPGSAAGDTEDDVARISIDELIVKGKDGETANAFQYRLILHSGGGSSTGNGSLPKVRQVACTIKNTLPGQAISKSYPDGAPDLANLDIDLDVPTYSQYTRDSQISGSICSPTCVAMVLGYYGIDISPEESAWNARDYEAGIFGNWSFNLASAASYGLTGYVDYIVPEEGADPWYAVKQQIAAHRPVVVSVKYRKPGFPSPLPPVEGVPINHTDGHLVLVRGFTWKDGVEYVIVNDPAAANEDDVRREYRADEFFDAWVKRAAYIIFEDKNEAEEIYRPAPLSGQLIPLGKPKDGYQAFKLQLEDEAVDVSTLNIRSIVVSFEGRKTTPVGSRRSGEGSDLLWVKTDSEPGTYAFTFMGRSKDYYQAEITLPLPKSNTPVLAAGIILAAAVSAAVMLSRKGTKVHPVQQAQLDE